MTYKMNPSITVHAVTIELTVDQIRELTAAGDRLYDTYDGQIPVHFQPLAHLCDELNTLLAQEAPHA
jgi:hypothetical protein